MWGQDTNSNAHEKGNNADGQNFQYFNDGVNDWDPSADRGRIAQPTFERYMTPPLDQQHTVGDNVDVFQASAHTDTGSGRDASMAGSNSSGHFNLHENFYQDHPSLNNGAEDYGFRSSSVASNSSVNAATANRGYLYERLTHDHSPSLEALSQNTSARIQSFDSAMSGMGGAMHSGGELRTSNASSVHNTRHARRLYVGGIPQNNTSEEILQHYLNDVCSKCMEEENDSSYVISVYMNHKKCFAFVELKTIELTSVCLELDGIVYFSNILKIQRANEYKPELMVNFPRTPIHFVLKNAPFPNKGHNSGGMEKKHSMYGGRDDHGNSSEYTPRINPGSHSSPTDVVEKFQYSSTNSSTLIRQCTVGELSRGTLALLGFPYDEGAKRSGHVLGASSGPRAARHHLYQLLRASPSGGEIEVGANVNPEFGIDWSRGGRLLCDVGDIPPGLPLEEALSRLGESVAEIIRRGGVPLVLGGSGDMSYANAAGLMTVAGGSIGIVSINSQLNVTPQRSESKIQATSASRLLLSDTRFCPPREGLMSEPWCDGKFVHFAAQGTQSSTEEVGFVEERGGKIVWLSRDIRQVNPFAPASAVVSDGAGQMVRHGTENLQCPSPSRVPMATAPSDHSPARLVSLLNPVLAHLKGTSRKRPIYMSLHLEALHDSVLPGVASRSYDGLSAQEAIQVCLLAGADCNVALFDLCGLNPEVEGVKSPMLVAQLVYSFVLGFLRRTRREGDEGHSSGSPSSTTPPLPLP